MSESKFYNSGDIRPLYDEIVPAYQVAFAGEPWFEVSKCEDKQRRCIGGLSSLAVGSVCEVCGKQLVRPAYEKDELIERFEMIANTRPTAWYTEQSKNGLTLAAVAWNATSAVIAQEKYADVPMMASWLQSTLGNTEIMWLDEVFANKDIKPNGNLQNFGGFVTGLAERLGAQTIAYRTIEPRMVTAAERDFKQMATIFKRQESVPDRRDFVIIKLNREL